MLNLDLLRREPEKFRTLLRQRGVTAERIDHILGLDASRRQMITELDMLRAEHKRASKKVGPQQAIGRDQLATLRQMSDEIKKLEEKLRAVQSQMESSLSGLPNLPREESLPVATTGTTIRRREAKTRADKPEATELQCVGYKPILKNTGVLLERAIVNSLVETYAAQGYKEVMLPLLARPDAFLASGELPVMEGYLLKCLLDDLILTPSLEASLAYLYADDILPNNVLPLRHVSFGPAFNPSLIGCPKHRFDTRPAYPFGEVAAYSYTNPRHSEQEFSLLVNILEDALQQLNLPYQVVLLSVSNLGFASELSYWHKVWFPAKNAYVQVAATNSYGSFQARRSNTRFRPASGEKPQYVCSVSQAISVGLLLASILENGQTSDGSVRLPKPLSTRLGINTLTSAYSRALNSGHGQGKGGA
jgi:seryl-tRNA synthetase